VTRSEFARDAAARLAALKSMRATKAEIAEAERKWREALHAIGVGSCDEQTALRVLSERRKP